MEKIESLTTKLTKLSSKQIEHSKSSQNLSTNGISSTSTPISKQVMKEEIKAKKESEGIG